MESTATNPSVEVTPISQSSVDPIIEDSTNQTTTVISSSEGTTVTSAPSSDPIDQVAANLQSANASVANFAANAIEVAREGAHEIETKTIDGINYAYDFAVVSKELAGEFAVATKVKAIQSKDYLLEKAKSSKDLALEKAVKSKEFVLEKAKSSKDFTVEKAVQSKEFVAEKTTEGKDLLLEKADQSKEFAAMSLEKENNSCHPSGLHHERHFWTQADGSIPNPFNPTDLLSRRLKMEACGSITPCWHPSWSNPSS